MIQKFDLQQFPILFFKFNRSLCYVKIKYGAAHLYPGGGMFFMSELFIFLCSVTKQICAIVVFFLHFVHIRARIIKIHQEHLFFSLKIKVILFFSKLTIPPGYLIVGSSKFNSSHNIMVLENAK